MPTEDRGNHEKRQDKKRRNIQQTRYQTRNNRQNTEQASTILWTSESVEERTIPQNSIQRLCTWSQKDGKAKETMDRHNQRGLQRTASVLTLHEATCRTQDRRMWRATIDERLTRSTASSGP